MKMQIIIHILKSGCDKTIEDDGYLGQDSHDSISLLHNGNKSHCGRHKVRLDSHRLLKLRSLAFWFWSVCLPLVHI